MNNNSVWFLVSFLVAIITFFFEGGGLAYAHGSRHCPAWRESPGRSLKQLLTAQLPPLILFFIYTVQEPSHGTVPPTGENLLTSITILKAILLRHAQKPQAPRFKFPQADNTDYHRGSDIHRIRGLWRDMVKKWTGLEKGLPWGPQLDSSDSCRQLVTRASSLHNETSNFKFLRVRRVSPCPGTVLHIL